MLAVWYCLDVEKFSMYLQRTQDQRNVGFAFYVLHPRAVIVCPLPFGFSLFPAKLGI